MNPKPFENRPWTILTAHITHSHEDDCACADQGLVLRMEAGGGDENDCACPDHGVVLGQAGVQMDGGVNDCLPADPQGSGYPNPDRSKYYLQAVDTFSVDLPHGFHGVLHPYSLTGPSVLDPASWARLQSYREPQGLFSELDTALAGEHLIQPVGSCAYLSPAQIHTLTAWLHVTNACNLDCPYCYVQKSMAHMAVPVGLRALEQVFYTARKHGFKAVKIKYAGGEPTLNFKLVQQLHQKTADLAARGGLATREVILTNGTCLQNWQADWFLENQVRMMISLDGTSGLHDQLRPCRQTGHGSFARVAAAIDHLLLPRGLKPSISITITQLNAHGVADAVRWALDRQLPVSLNFYRQPQSSSSKSELALEEETLIQGMLSAYAVFAQMLPASPFSHGLLDRVQSSAHQRPCGVGQSYVVITHEGQVAQCQMALDHAMRVEGEGDLLAYIQRGPIRNLPVDEKDDCASCVLRYRCAGGCPLEAYRVTGRWGGKSPNCQIYRTLLPEVLRLESLRLMKIHGYLH